MTHICNSKLTTICSDNGLPPGRRQAIIWTNARVLLIGTLEINLYAILSKIWIFLLKKTHLQNVIRKMAAFLSCLGFNVLTAEES